jgi:transcriptional regulator with XRE-family HTH domain
MGDETVAEKVDSLFKTFPKDSEGNEYSYRDVEEGTGGAVTATTVWKLRTGRIHRPSLQVIEALCQFFNVPISYFSSEKPASEEYLQNLRLATRLRRAKVKEAALQISDLDDAAIQDLLGMVKYIRTARQAERDHSPAPEDESTE